MYHNIGGKLKLIARLILCMGVLGAVAYSVFSIALDTLSLGAGVLFAFIGSAGAVVLSYLFYGIGQLVENTDAIVHADVNSK